MNIASIAKHDDLVLRGKCPYSEFFGPNAEKYRPEKLRIRTLFTQCDTHKPHFFKSFFLGAFPTVGTWFVSKYTLIIETEYGIEVKVCLLLSFLKLNKISQIRSRLKR